MLLLGRGCRAATSSSEILARGDVVRAHRRSILPILALVLRRRIHQVGAVPVPLLAAARHGGADAGLRLPALGDDGEGGIFLLGRLWPVLAGTEAWFWSSPAPALVTMLVGAWIALYKDDLKALLAYLDGQPSRADHDAARHRHAARRGGRGVPHPQPRTSRRRCS